MPKTRNEALVLTALWREDAADLRAQVAERRMLRIVAEWREGSGIDVLQSSDGRGRLQVRIQSFGDVSPDWCDDTIHALSPIGAFARRRASRAPALTHAAAELVRDPSRTYAVPDDDGEPRANQVQVVWPESRRDHQLVSLMLHETPGAYVRTVIAAPSGI